MDQHEVSKNSSRKWLIVSAFALVLALLVITVVWICPWPRPTVVTVSDCAGESVRITRVDQHGNPVATFTQIPLSGPITDIPEFHDCQRFVEGRSFGALYAIFASFRLGVLLEDLEAADSFAHTHNRAYGLVPTATIYSYGGDYASLGIKPGFNCLFVFRHNDQWGAKMVPLGESDPDCGDRNIDAFTATGTALLVRSTSNTNTSYLVTDADYPPVARWDWDPQGHEHYVGIKCGPAWCEVGSPAFTSSGPYAGPTLSFGPPGQNGMLGVPQSSKDRISAVKGWYDAQELATVTTAGVTQPGGIHGTLIPHPALDNIVQSASVQAYLNKWVPVADAILDAPYKYFKQGQNQILFCHGQAAECAVSLPPSSPQATCPWDLQDNLPWWAMVVSGNDRVFRCVTRVNHSAEVAAYKAAHPLDMGVRFTGAARWRWVANDETEWISCPSGCCTLK